MNNNSNGRFGLEKLIPALVTIQTAILVAAIPWAMGIQTSVARLEEKMTMMAPATRLVDFESFAKLRERVVILEHKVRKP